MGGREQVLNTPTVDLLGYLLIYFNEEEEKAKIQRQELYINHVLRSLSNPQTKEQAKAAQKFLKQLSADESTNQNTQVLTRKDLNWDDFDKIKRIENS
ncbi:hypothetical protein EAF23_05950 [Staphylococcus pseudintermedius]|nr:hypothetical protein [Staphylococcus pseudintermedius]